MDVSLNVRPVLPLRPKIGDIVVDDHIDLLDIDTAGDDIGGDQNLGLAVPEAIENVVSVAGHLVAVK